MYESQIDDLLKVCLLISLSILGRFLLVRIGQTWVKTFAHTSTLILLPIITFVITKVISGNIALSLGMVGALSIVRFRNPVKSPLELSVYFTSITMGIAASVSDQWIALLVMAILLATIALTVVNFFYKKIFAKPFFITSFSEGNSLPTLVVKSTISIEKLERSGFLISKSKNENEIGYILTSKNFKNLQDMLLEIEKNPSILNYQLNS